MDTEEVEIEAIRPLFDAITLVEESLPPLDALLATMEPNRDLMRQRAAEGFSSVTALAETIQTQANLSYRTAHRIVAHTVLLAVEQNKDATAIDTSLIDQAANEMIQKPLKLDANLIRQCLDPSKFVDHHKVPGGPAPTEVRRMATDRRARWNDDAQQIARRKERAQDRRRQAAHRRRKTHVRGRRSMKMRTPLRIVECPSRDRLRDRCDDRRTTHHARRRGCRSSRCGGRRKIRR